MSGLKKGCLCCTLRNGFSDTACIATEHTPIVSGHAHCDRVGRHKCERRWRAFSARCRGGANPRHL